MRDLSRGNADVVAQTKPKLDRAPRNQYDLQELRLGTIASHFDSGPLNAALSRLRGLTSLDLDFNLEYTSFPEAVCDLTRLRRLCLSGTPSSWRGPEFTDGLPADLTRLSALEELRLAIYIDSGADGGREERGAS